MAFERLRQRIVVIGIFSALVVSVAGCASRFEMGNLGPHDAVDPVRTADFSARYPADPGGTTSGGHAAGRPWLFPGLGGPPAPANATENNSASVPASAGGAQGGISGASPGVTEEGDGVVVNFDNADIRAVAKSVLNDTLGLNVIIDPRIQGSITLASANPIPRKDLMAAFEEAMRMSNAAVVRQDNFVKIVPLSDASGSGAVGLPSPDSGFGVTIVPLHYTSAETVAQAAENFLTRPGAVRADPIHNLLMVQGTASERQNVLDMISSFDVSWMRNQSVGIFPLSSASPDTMIQELQRVFQTGDGGEGRGMISFQPINRMNAIMAVTRDRSYLRQAAVWIARLDRDDMGGTTARVYHLQYGNADTIAKILNAIFVSQGGLTHDTAADQLAPGTNGALAHMDAAAGGGQNNSAFGTLGNSSSSSAAATQAGGGLVANDSNVSEASSFDSFSNSKKNGGPTITPSGDLPKGVFQNVRIVPDTSDNSIIIYSNEDDYQAIERSIHSLDRPQLQVAIEATIAEVTLNDALQYGVQYYFGSSDVGAGVNHGSISLTTSAASTLINPAIPGLNVLIGSQAAPKVILSALSSLTTVKVLSSPSLVVSNNQPAFLQVGDSVPISTGSATVLSTSNTVVNTVTMQDIGIILKVWPHIHANGSVELEIEQEVSNVVGGIPPNGTTNLNPTISQRRIHTSVGVASGQTVLLGGLMSENDNKSQSGIPILQQIRGLGDLFSTTNDTKDRTEIIVFVKPRIIRSGYDAEDVAEEFRNGLSTMHPSPTIVSGIGVRKDPSYLVVK
ncbi:MAG: type II secretion system secretin GspD [Pseudomonadota bacterium]